MPAGVIPDAKKRCGQKGGKRLGQTMASLLRRPSIRRKGAGARSACICAVRKARSEVASFLLPCGCVALNFLHAAAHARHVHVHGGVSHLGGWGPPPVGKGPVPPRTHAYFISTSFLPSSAQTLQSKQEAGKQRAWVHGGMHRKPAT